MPPPAAVMTATLPSSSRSIGQALAAFKAQAGCVMYNRVAMW
jgi:hypothetical protein